MFSLAERTLIYSLSDTQGSTLYLLKALYKHTWAGAESPVICSYYVKTACFWTLEQHGAGNVTVVELTKKVLKMLLKFYSEWNLPHYFIPKQNLINQISQCKCRKVVEQIEELVGEFEEYTLGSLSMGTQIPFYINSIREEIGLISKPRQTLRDHQAFVQRLKLSVNNVGSLVRVTKVIQRGSTEYSAVRRIHILDAMENVKVDLFNAMKQVIKFHRKATNSTQCNVITPSLPPINVSNQPNGSFPRKPSITSSNILLQEAKVYENILRDFEEIVRETEDKMATTLEGGQLDSYKLFLKRGLGEAYLHLSLLATATGIGQTCQSKATECLRTTMEIAYHDNQEMFVFDGHFNLALFHYQNCEYSKVIDLMKDMKPCSPHDPDFVALLESSVYPITINPNGSEEELNKWRGDWELFRSLAKRKENIMVNPAAFAFYMYIQARRVLGYALLEEMQNQTVTPSSATQRYRVKCKYSKGENWLARTSPVSMPSQWISTDEDLLDKMQNSHYSYGADATNILLRILCE